ncbi:MAG: hypothetical protein KJ737_23025 [Proteobacteria bacterium]|nr:hypothetical protein [Pseudomonadota bacterium]
MLLKMGVDISRLGRPIRRALNQIKQVFQNHGKEAVITSTYEGNHSSGSLHYANLAVDVRSKDLGETERKELLKELKGLLGGAYDITPEGDHLHVEYDPE